MKKKLMAMALVVAVMVAAVLGVAAVPQKALAASKKAFYIGSLLTEEMDGSACITSVKIKDGKLILKGTVTKAKSLKDYESGNGTLLKSKKRTFKMTKNCTFWGSGGEAGLEKISKTELMDAATQYTGLGLFIYTNKSGKVYKMVIAS